MMILPLYFIRRFLIILFMTLLAVLILSFVIDTIESSKTISQEGIGFNAVFSLLINKFIVMCVQTFPLSVYISLVILLFTLHIRNEYLALLTSAKNPSILLFSLMPLMVIISMIYFFLLDSVLPHFSKEVDRLMVHEFKRFTFAWTYFYRDRNWFLGRNNTLYHYLDIDEKNRAFRDFEIIKYSEEGINEIILVNILRHIRDGEYFAEGIKKYIIRGDKEIEIASSGTSLIYLDEGYELFRQRRGRPFQMSISELREFIEIRERAGIDSSRFRFEFYSRFINPLSLLLLCLIIMILFVKKFYLYHYGYFLLNSMFIVFAYFLSYLLSSKISESALKMPLLSALIPLLFIFLAFAIFMAKERFKVYLSN